MLLNCFLNFSIAFEQSYFPLLLIMDHQSVCTGELSVGDEAPPSPAAHMSVCSMHYLSSPQSWP